MSRTRSQILSNILFGDSIRRRFSKLPNPKEPWQYLQVDQWATGAGLVDCMIHFVNSIITALRTCGRIASFEAPEPVPGSVKTAKNYTNIQTLQILTI